MNTQAMSATSSRGGANSEIDIALASADLSNMQILEDLDPEGLYAVVAPAGAAPAADPVVAPPEPGTSMELSISTQEALASGIILAPRPSNYQVFRVTTDSFESEEDYGNSDDELSDDELDIVEEVSELLRQQQLDHDLDVEDEVEEEFLELQQQRDDELVVEEEREEEVGHEAVIINPGFSNIRPDQARDVSDQEVQVIDHEDTQNMLQQMGAPGGLEVMNTPICGLAVPQLGETEITHVAPTGQTVVMSVMQRITYREDQEDTASQKRLLAVKEDASYSSNHEGSSSSSSSI